MGFLSRLMNKEIHRCKDCGKIVIGSKKKWREHQAKHKKGRGVRTRKIGRR